MLTLFQLLKTLTADGKPLTNEFKIQMTGDSNFDEAPDGLIEFFAAYVNRHYAAVDQLDTNNNFNADIIQKMKTTYHLKNPSMASLHAELSRFVENVDVQPKAKKILIDLN
ncbi:MULTISPECIES: hypothetical protein [Loigolactobacillus]|uniref:Uncharacterized protein n=1 Tax=Loigolactobacillus backii TaxID=375175 RepID=A0A192GYA5_9LACO|nr:MULTISPECIES: hypothetical protein [Loigolactobacillus]ANK58838.1 hypothetical protein AYR52_00305 [Loigolactobacillus backii]ANK61499.1 hypothetical protein AYR53_01205 [Loigolactobacillus backii]ANK63828.1 hypothetical protein AYR54_00300 [Loigolactobacillus backii]ANK66276.1 hypothetical protein AYR55_00300 [Loigolactobacillus backii]ANK69303.1 hypothetical protein AYR56_03510 [Loigolactobacillus backii]